MKRRICRLCFGTGTRYVPAPDGRDLIAVACPCGRDS